MIQIPTPRDVETLAFEAGTTVAQACAKAGLTRDVFTRWKRGVGKGGIGVENLRKIIDQLRVAILGECQMTRRPLATLKVVVDHTIPPDELRVHPSMFALLEEALLEADEIRRFGTVSYDPVEGKL